LTAGWRIYGSLLVSKAALSAARKKRRGQEKGGQTPLSIP